MFRSGIQDNSCSVSNAQHDDGNSCEGVGRRRAGTEVRVMVKTVAALAAALMLSGCATKPSLYAWGQYEQLIYFSYKSPSVMSPEKQVVSLEQDYQKARAASQRLPPGWHAHLGYFYSQMGKINEAARELQLEKAEFPESTVFVDYLLAKLPSRPIFDYSNYPAHSPHSILVLPPLSKTSDADATYSCLSTISEPLAEHGYYVFPVAVVDQILKEQGMQGAKEMHQISLDKVTELTGADAVLYLDITKYALEAVTIEARLVDTRSAALLWAGSASAQDESSESDTSRLPHNLWDFLGDLARDVAVDLLLDKSHDVCRQAIVRLVESGPGGLPHGPYYPKSLTN